MRWVLNIAPLFVALLTSACSTQSELRFTSSVIEVGPARAVVVPPPGGPSIVAVLQRKYRNGVSQEIALSTASRTIGQNAIYVSMVNDLHGYSEIDDTLSIPGLAPDRIAGEMEERFPGVEMHTSLLYAQNKYGPFGFATGRSALGDTCLYAWQLIEPNEKALLTPGGMVSIRLRLCDMNGTTEQLLRTMYHFNIVAYFESVGWNPFGSTPPLPPSIGAPDAPISPLSTNIYSVPTPLEASPQPLGAESARRTAPRTEAPAPIRDISRHAPPAVQETGEPLTGYPVVPPPP